MTAWLHLQFQYCVDRHFPACFQVPSNQVKKECINRGTPSSLSSILRNSRILGIETNILCLNHQLDLFPISLVVLKRFDLSVHYGCFQTLVLDVLGYSKFFKNHFNNVGLIVKVDQHKGSVTRQKFFLFFYFPYSALNSLHNESRDILK